jgi:hypothetical protein
MAPTIGGARVTANPAEWQGSGGVLRFIDSGYQMDRGRKAGSKKFGQAGAKLTRPWKTAAVRRYASAKNSFRPRCSEITVRACAISTRLYKYCDDAPMRRFIAQGR